jgi:hypothetical protein
VSSFCSYEVFFEDTMSSNTVLYVHKRCHIYCINIPIISALHHIREITIKRFVVTPLPGISNHVITRMMIDSYLTMLVQPYRLHIIAL